MFGFIFQNGIGLLLKHVSHDEFKSVLLPAVQKALLRNPEAIAQGEFFKKPFRSRVGSEVER